MFRERESSEQIVAVAARRGERGVQIVNTPTSRRPQGDGYRKAFVVTKRPHYLWQLMPKPIARSKTRKAVAKRFKITARGKVLRAQSSRRHLLSAKNAKRKRQLSKPAQDVARIKANLPFG